MNLSNVFSENIILPVSDLLFKKKVGRYLTFLNKSQFWPKEKLGSYQNTKLMELVNFAYKYVPFYRDLFSRLRLVPEDIRAKEDLEKIPILKKAIIKKEGIDRFTSTAIPIRKMIKSSSSGSTGEPLFYYRNREAYSMNIAANLRGWYWMGFKLGDKYVVLSQNPRNNLFKRLQDKFSNNLYLATNPLIDSNFEYILKEIERYKPKIIRCYPDPLLFLAKFRKVHPEYAYTPQFITTTGNTLHSETREEIEKAFGCKIFDSYSCEGNSNVFECPTHNCYHSTAEYGISEFLDENDNQIENGVARLVSTDLWNLAHPFIRYDTQDFVEISSEPCACGRSLPRINRIIGRDNDILQTANGRKFIVHNFTGFFQLDHIELNRSVELFQVIQKKNGHFLFRLVVNDKFRNTAKSFIENYWTKEFDAPVEIEIVTEIPLTKSGKRKFIIKETL